MSQPNSLTNKSILLSLIQQTVDSSLNPNELQQGSDSYNLLQTEVEDLFQQPQLASELVQLLFPEGIPTDFLFYKRLYKFQVRIGFDNFAHKTTGLFWASAIRILEQDQITQLMKTFQELPGGYIFIALNWFPTVIEREKLSVSYCAECFQMIFKRISDDPANSIFWNSVDLYCRIHVTDAISVTRIILDSLTENYQQNVASRMLGTLRTVPLAENEKGLLTKLETDFETHQDIKKQICYFHSWPQTAWLGQFVDNDMSVLLRKLENSDNLLAECGVQVVSSILTWCQDKNASWFQIGFEWLGKNLSPHISPSAKNSFIQFAVHYQMTEKITAYKSAFNELLLAILPISSDFLGIWQNLDHYLADLLEKDHEEFNKFFIKFAEVSSQEFLKVLKEPNFPNFLLVKFSELKNFASIRNLLVSNNSSCRKLGLYYSEKLRINFVKCNFFKNISMIQLKILFYELQRSNIIDYQITAQLLVSLLPKGLKADNEFKQELTAELLLQAKNHSNCRKIFQENSKKLPILKQVLAEFEAYQNKLKALENSSINAMEVPGLRKALQLASRKFSNQIQEGIGKYSVVYQFLTKVTILYGSEWVVFNNQNFGEISSFKSHSYSNELPLMEILYPEEMNLRRLWASYCLNNLEELINQGVAK